MLAVSAMLTSSSAYVPASAVAPTRPTHTVRQRAVFMDETIMEKALALMYPTSSSSEEGRRSRDVLRHIQK